MFESETFKEEPKSDNVNVIEDINLQDCIDECKDTTCVGIVYDQESQVCKIVKEGSLERTTGNEHSIVLDKIVPKEKRRLAKDPKFQIFDSTTNTKPNTKSWTCTHKGIYNALSLVVDKCVKNNQDNFDFTDDEREIRCETDKTCQWKRNQEIVGPNMCCASDCGWQEVRYVPQGKTVHPANDGLKGTDIYGVPFQYLTPWSIKFDDKTHN